MTTAMSVKGGLIAATALANQLAVATENVDHFRRISGLEIESWKGEQS